jgi:hypothetical protein
MHSKQQKVRLSTSKNLPQPTSHRRQTRHRAPQRVLWVQVAPEAVTSEPAAPERRSLLPSPWAQSHAARWCAIGVWSCGCAHPPSRETHQAADKYSATHARPHWGDDMRPVTPSPSWKEELYYHKEGHSHTSAMWAHMRSKWGAPHKRPCRDTAERLLCRCCATGWITLGHTQPLQPCLRGSVHPRGRIRPQSAAAT